MDSQVSAHSNGVWDEEGDKKSHYMASQQADDFAWLSDIDMSWGGGLLFVCCSCHGFWLILYGSTVSAMFALCLVEDLRLSDGMRAFNGFTLPERMHG